MQRAREGVRHAGQRERGHRCTRRQQSLPLERQQEPRAVLRANVRPAACALIVGSEQAVRRARVEVVTFPELRERRSLRGARRDQGLRGVIGGGCETAPASRSVQQ